jgi:hypothetical protein
MIFIVACFITVAYAVTYPEFPDGFDAKMTFYFSANVSFAPFKNGSLINAHVLNNDLKVAYPAQDITMTNLGDPVTIVFEIAKKCLSSCYEGKCCQFNQFNNLFTTMTQFSEERVQWPVKSGAVPCPPYPGAACGCGQSQFIQPDFWRTSANSARVNGGACAVNGKFRNSYTVFYCLVSIHIF